jgi:hypothetical protein
VEPVWFGRLAPNPEDCLYWYLKPNPSFRLRASTNHYQVELFELLPVLEYLFDGAYPKVGKYSLLDSLGTLAKQEFPEE